MGELGRRIERRIDALLDAPEGAPEDPYRAAARLLEPLTGALPPPGPDENGRLVTARARVKGL
jgi:hypothetical protein